MSNQRRRVAMGDPQAPFEKVKSILARHQLLDETQRLRSDVQLTSMGDHFDWGKAGTRISAGNDGFELLTWLASHPPEQVQIVLGNHDLARVGELAGFDDAGFATAYAEAAPIYAAEDDDVAEREFLRRWPDVPSAETVARDFSTFQVRQRVLVESLLGARRLRLAYAGGPSLLMLHAGVTRDELAALGLSAVPQRDAEQVAAALNAALDRAVDGRKSGPLVIPGLHVPGSAAYGEGRGILYHRPELAERGRAEHFAGPPRRRFDPRRLPAGLTQVIGHIRDSKCQTLLDAWVEGPRAGDGPLRTLVVDGERGVYRAGTEAPFGTDSARIFFTDGGMGSCPIEAYELLDLDTGKALTSRPA